MYILSKLSTLVLDASMFNNSDEGDFGKVFEISFTSMSFSSVEAVNIFFLVFGVLLYTYFHINYSS